MAQGTEKKGGFKIASVWGTAVELASTDGFIYTGAKGPSGDKKLLSLQSVGLNPETEPERGNIEGLDLGVSANLDYYNLVQVLACLFGHDTVTQQGAVDVYDHLLVWRRELMAAGLNSDLEIFGTMALDHMEHGIHEYPSVKLVGATISGKAGEFLKVELQGMAIGPELSSATNTEETFAALTYLTKTRYVLFGHGVFRLNLQDDVALSDTEDVQAIDEFSLAIKRGMSPHFCAEDPNAVTRGYQTRQPYDQGKSTWDLTLRFPTRDAANLWLLESAIGGETLKFDATFTGRQITGAYYDLFRLRLPALSPYAPSVDLNNPNQHPFEVKFMATASEDEGSVAGMTDVTGFGDLMFRNSNSTDFVG